MTFLIAFTATPPVVAAGALVGAAAVGAPAGGMVAAGALVGAAAAGVSVGAAVVAGAMVGMGGLVGMAAGVAVGLIEICITGTPLHAASSGMSSAPHASSAARRRIIGWLCIMGASRLSAPPVEARVWPHELGGMA